MLSLTERLKWALQEDIGRGDATTLATIPVDQQGRARFELKGTGILAGFKVAEQVFALVDPDITIEWLVPEGQLYTPMVFAQLQGNMRSILLGERLALNLMQRMSGIATITHRYAQALQGSSTRLLDTRKTTPLWRDLEKQAVLMGGGVNHRFGLDDGILIKDNHIAAAGGVENAIKRAKESAYLLKIECEVGNMQELRQALEAGADRVMLDNMDNAALLQAVQLRNEIAPHISLEASGNMTLSRLPSVAQTGVDYISVGALTHSAPNVDISLEVLAEVFADSTETTPDETSAGSEQAQGSASESDA